MTSSTVIVGAGPAGLAVAAMLSKRGVPYRIFEKSDQVAAAWRSRYDSLHLHTIRWLSGLPGASIPRRFGPWVSRDDLVAYLEAYARRFDIRPDVGTELLRVDRDRDGWLLRTTRGTQPASRVVLATGYSHTPHLPCWPGAETFRGDLYHSATYRNPTGLRGANVLVVGAGNSATEVAVDLAGVADHVWLSVRTPPNIVPRDMLGVPTQLLGIALDGVPEPIMNRVSTVLRRLTVPDLRSYGLPAPQGDGFSQFLRSRSVPILDHGFVRALRAGKISVVPDIDSLHEQQVRLVGGRILQPDAVIAATGYRSGLRSIVGHLDVLDKKDAPQVQGAQTLPSAPDLYFVGISVELAGLLREIGRQAHEVARVIALREGRAGVRRWR